MEEGINSLAVSTPQEMDPSLFDNEVARIAKENPREFGDSLVSGLGEIDPQLVAEFKRDLAQLNPSAAIIDALQEMVDEILANPQDYEAIRTKYLNQEVPEELLPAFFDPAFFGGLDLALIELEKNIQRPEPPVEMSEGGVASVAQEIARMGRRGDTMLAHITPEEARLLRRRGGSGTINPVTGLPEFFLKKIFKSAKSILKGVGKAVNKFAKSDVGRIALTIAATYYMGPKGFNFAAGTFSGATLAGVQAAAANTLVNLAAGESLKDSLKGGIINGVTAGFGQAFSSALPDTLLGVNLGPESLLRGGIGGALAGTGVGLARGQSFKDALRSGVEGAAQSAARQLVTSPFTGEVKEFEDSFFPEVSQKYRATDNLDAPDYIGKFVEGTGKAFDTARSGIGKNITSGRRSNEPLLVDKITDTFTSPFRKGREFIGDFFADEKVTQREIDNFRKTRNIGSSLSDEEIKYFLESVSERNPGMVVETQKGPGTKGIEYLTSVPERVGSFVDRTGERIGQFGKDIVAGYQRNLPYPPNATVGEKIGRGIDVAGDLVETGARKTYDYFSPSKREEAFLAERDYENAKNILDKQLTDGVIKKDRYNFKLREAAKRAEQKIGTLGKYGPLASGLGALAYAGGAFDPPQEEEESLIFDPYYGGLDYMRDYSNRFPSFSYRTYDPYLYAKGGDVQEFPRKTGAVNGPGTGTSDDIPAMLSDGEFVMTAKAVRSMGKGSRRKGAAKMYKLMRELEKRTA